jgi:hypothetical protein
MHAELLNVALFAAATLKAALLTGIGPGAIVIVFLNKACRRHAFGPARLQRGKYQDRILKVVQSFSEAADIPAIREAA